MSCRTKSLWPMIFVISVLLGCDVPVAVNGTVTDASGSPIEGALVELKREDDDKTLLKIESDMAGKFQLYRIGAESEYLLSLKKDGYETEEKLFKSRGTESVQLDFVLKDDNDTPP